MLTGTSAKREREYEDLKEKFEDEGRYKGREEEVAARIVNKQRAEQGETIAAKEDDKHGQSPDRDLPLPNYDQLTIDTITSQLGKLSDGDIEKLRDYEQKHRDRVTLLEVFDRFLKK